MTRPRKNPSASGIRTRIFRSRGGRPTTRPTRWWAKRQGVCLESGRPGFDSRFLCRSFSKSNHTSDFITPVATLPGAWRYRVSTGTGWTGVSILEMGDIARLLCNFYLSVAARATVLADASLRYTSMLLGRSAINHQPTLAHSLARDTQRENSPCAICVSSFAL